VLDYLLGTRSFEKQNGGDFRDRDTVFGDIVNSDPLFVGTPNFGYQSLPGTEGTSYTTFRGTSSYTNRPPMVYVGANDGLLHAIDAREDVASGGGTEKFAYMPLTVFPNLKKLTSVSYTHQFYVNGSPQAGDAYIGGAWKTVLVGTLGAGGRGVFALDITDPTAFGPSKVLWEKSVTGDTNVAVTDDTDLGFTYSQASIGRMANGKWAAIVANGLNSANRHAVLFIYDLADGSLIKKIDTGVGSATLDNGLSTPVIVDTNNDKIVDYIYAGDMQGNLWKFDVSDPSESNWDVAYKPGGVNTPLFKATAPDGTSQPITAKPQVTRRPDGDLQVLFGTGKYFEGQDRSVPPSPTPQTQTFYGIRDPGTPFTGRTSLVQQSVISVTTLSGFTVRTVTAGQPTSTTQNGWYLDLPTAGERQVSRAVLRTGRIIFTTVIPNSDSCSAGGTSWLMEVDALTGSRLAKSPFDLDNDGKFDETVTITVTVNGQPQDIQVPVSGMQSEVGVMGTAGVAQEGNREFKYISGSSGGIQVTLEPGDLGAGRQSWQQLQ
jgi:type IV pilus assembly protein PilY1